MLIQSLTIQDFRSHHHTELALQPFSVIRGRNGDGKSTVEHAIEYLFCGRTAATGASGQGAVGLIRSGASTATVQAVVDLGQGEVREVRARLNAAGRRDTASRRPGEKSWEGADLVEHFQANRDVLSCLINGRHFVDLKPADQKRILASIVLPKTYAYDDDVKAALDKAGIRPDWTLPPFELIEQAYKLSYDARTLARREREVLRVPEMPEAAGDVADIRAKLDGLRDRLADLNAKRANDAQRRESFLSRRLSAEQRLAGAEQTIQAEGRSMEQEKEKLLSAKDKKDVAALAAKGPKAVDLDGKIAAIQAQQAVYQKQLEAIDELEGATCPTCRQAVTAEAFKSLTDPIASAYSKILDEMAEHYRQRREIGDWQAAQRRLEAHQAAEVECKRIQTRIEKAQADANGARVDLDQPYTGAPEQDCTAEIAALEERISKGTDMLTKAASALAMRTQHEKISLGIRALDAKIELLEGLVSTFGPNEIKAELIAQHVGPFQAAINHVLEAWGYTALLSIEPYGFTVARMAGAPRELHLLSKSERYRFAVAFQVALAKVSGWNFVVIDEADILDSSSRALFNRSLLSAGLDQVIVMATDERDTVPALPPNSIFWMLSTGPDGTQARAIGSALAMAS